MKRIFKNPYLVIFLLTVFSACNKEMDEVSPLSASVTLNGLILDENGEKMTLEINPNPAVVGQSVTVTATKVSGDAGVLTLQEFIGTEWLNVDEDNDPETIENTLIISSATLGDNGRTFRAFFNKESGNNDFYSPSLSLTVTEVCDFSITPITTTVGAPEGNMYTFETTFEVKTCGRAVYDIKLQGGLTSGATLVQEGTTENYTLPKASKGGKGNTIVSWNVGSMGETETKVYKIVYKKNIDCGMIDNITGEWSAKGKFVDDNSPALAGYSVRQTFETAACQQ